MKLGTNDIGSVYLGTNAVQKVYLGTNEVWTSFTGLLDDYPNAAAAYSLRRLSGAYGGSAIGVRIDTTGQPEYNIGFVDGELDVATLEGYCTGGLNAFVKTWYDQSGNGYDASQTTSASQPQIVSSGSVILKNGKPTLQFDGINDFFNTGNKLLQLNTTVTIAFDFTRENVLGVPIGQWSSNVTGRSLLATNQNTSGANISDNLNFFNSTATGFIDIVAPAGMNLSFWNIATGSGEYQIFNNGTNNYNGTITSIATNVNTALGVLSESVQSANFDGVLSELVFWHTIQSDRTGIETNINSHYNIY
jgi:hypothetical protein